MRLGGFSPLEFFESFEKDRYTISFCCVQRGLNSGTVVATPAALALKPHNSVFPCFSQASPKPLYLHQSQCEFLQARVCTWALSEDAWVSTSLWFQSDSLLGGLFFPALVFQTGEPSVGLRTLALWGGLAVQISLQIFNHHT